MTNLDPSFCEKVRQARRAAGLTQSDLAREVGCKQSAVSMFELGDVTKLNDETVAKIAKLFNLEVKPAEPEAAPVRPRVFVPMSPHTGFCPNPFCPSHERYTVDSRTVLLPDRSKQDPVGGKFCAICGELLERKCPNCGSPVHDGAVCSFCGQPYISTK